MTTRFILAMALATVTASISAYAEEYAVTTSDNVGAPNRAIILSGGENGINHEVMAVLYDTSELHFQDPEAPRFLFIDRQGNTVFGIGGYVEGVAQYDFDGAIDDVAFKTYEISVPKSADMRNRLGADMSHTNIFLQLIRRTDLGVLSGYVQGNFSGVGNTFKLKQAYLRWGHVTAGLARSTFQDAGSGVPTIDYQGPSGAVSRKNVLLQYRYDFANDFTVALSAELPKAGYTVLPTYNEAINQRFPDIPAYVQYQWDGGRSHVRASGIVRQLSYRDLVGADNRFRTGWGAQISGMVRCCPMATVFYQAVYGKGIANYINDLAGQNVDLIYDNRSGRMIAPASLGIVGGVRVNMCKGLFASASYSLCRLYDQSNLGADTYRRGNYFVANVFYSPMSDMQVGVEYVGGRRTNVDGSHGVANRLEAMVKYSF